MNFFKKDETLKKVMRIKKTGKEEKSTCVHCGSTYMNDTYVNGKHVEQGVCEECRKAITRITERDYELGLSDCSINQLLDIVEDAAVTPIPTNLESVVIDRIFRLAACIDSLEKENASLNNELYHAKNSIKEYEDAIDMYRKLEPSESKKKDTKKVTSNKKKKPAKRRTHKVLKAIHDFFDVDI